MPFNPCALLHWLRETGITLSFKKIYTKWFLSAFQTANPGQRQGLVIGLTLIVAYRLRELVRASEESEHGPPALQPPGKQESERQQRELSPRSSVRENESQRLARYWLGLNCPHSEN